MRGCGSSIVVKVNENNKNNNEDSVKNEKISLRQYLGR